MFVDRPILGVGVDNYPAYYQEYARPMEILTRETRSPHSLYIEIAAETGIIGVATFGILVVTLFWWLWRDWRLTDRPNEIRDLSRAIAVAVVGILTASIFLHSAYPRYLWLFIALALATHSVTRGFPIMPMPEARQTAGTYLVTPGTRPTAAPVLTRAVWTTGSILVVVALFAALSMNSVWIHTSALPAISAAELPGANTTEPTASQTPEPAGVVDPPAGSTATAFSTPETTGPANLPTLSPRAENTPTVATVPTPATPGPDNAALLAAQAPADALAGCVYFAEVEHNLCNPFSLYWAQNGGILTLGYPITEVFEADGRQMQYFERARLEIEATTTSPEGGITPSPLGTEMLAGLPNDVTEPTTLRPAANCQFHVEAEHNICALFRAYWLAYGGEAVFGQPLTEQFFEDGVLVQYFELARFEWRPGEWPERGDVLLGRIGAEALAQELEQ
jgi:hypothetical protein